MFSALFDVAHENSIIKLPDLGFLFVFSFGPKVFGRIFFIVFTHLMTFFFFWLVERALEKQDHLEDLRMCV